MTEQTRCTRWVPWSNPPAGETLHRRCNAPIRQKADGEGWEHYACVECSGDWNFWLHNPRPTSDAQTLKLGHTYELPSHPATPPVEVQV